MNNKTSKEDQEYYNRFASFEIDAAQFHHQQHLRVAYTLLVNNNFNQAYAKLKNNILGLLNHLGVGTDKYHETITVAWLLIVHHFMHTTDNCNSFNEFIEKNQSLLDQSILNNYYSEILLKTDEAKRNFIPADLHEIPSYGVKINLEIKNLSKKSFN